jgi:hypothetical protein
LAEAFGGNFHGFLAGDFKGGGAVEAGGEQFLDDGLDADDAAPSGMRPMPQPNWVPRFGSISSGMSFQCTCLMRGPKVLTNWSGSPPPSHELPVSRLMPTVSSWPKRVEDAGHAVHGVGEDAVGLQQQLDAEGFRPADRLVEFLADAEEALLVAEMVAEVGLRIALGGDDLFHAEEMRELDRLDDLAVP